MGFLLAGLVLLALGGICVFLPLLTCPLEPYLAYTHLRCPRCDDRGRITLFNRMRNGSQAVAPWEGVKVGWIEGSGFDRTNFRSALDLAEIFGGVPINNQKRIAAAKTLLGTGRYERVSVIVEHSSYGAKVTVSVVER